MKEVIGKSKLIHSILPRRIVINPFKTEAVIILLRKSMDWFLYDNDFRLERVNKNGIFEEKHIVNDSSNGYKIFRKLRPKH